MQITVVDYGLGNLGSVVNILRHLGLQAELTSNPALIAKATKLILPGVGAFGHGMENLRARGILDVLTQKVLHEKTPILGICLGMQLFFEHSTEGGGAQGLGWLSGEIVRFDFSSEKQQEKVPHVGWNTVELLKESPLFSSSAVGERFYFVHSFYVKCRKSEDALTTTRHGIDFVSSVQRGNIYGVQFHPEKSHRFGMNLLRNFAERA